MSKYSTNRGLLFNLTFGQGEFVISAVENLTTGLDWKLTKNEDGIYDPTNVCVSHNCQAGHDDFFENKTQSNMLFLWITF